MLLLIDDGCFGDGRAGLLLDLPYTDLFGGMGFPRPFKVDFLFGTTGALFFFNDFLTTLLSLLSLLPLFRKLPPIPVQRLPPFLFRCFALISCCRRNI